MPSATMAESSDSIAPSRANESASGSTACILSEENGGKAGSGNELGMPPKRVPMVSTGSLSKNTSTEPVATAIRIAGQLGLKRLTPTIRPMVTRHRHGGGIDGRNGGAKDPELGDEVGRLLHRRVRPSRSCTCPANRITAMPEMKPTVTGY